MHCNLIRTLIQHTANQFYACMSRNYILCNLLGGLPVSWELGLWHTLTLAPVSNLKVSLPPLVDTSRSANYAEDLLILSTWIGPMKRSGDSSFEVHHCIQLHVGFGCV